MKGNTATGNGLFGLALSASAHDNVLTDNVSSGNGEFGIVLFDAQNNRMTGNTALSNGVFDAAQDGTHHRERVGQQHVRHDVRNLTEVPGMLWGIDVSR